MLVAEDILPAEKHLKGRSASRLDLSQALPGVLAEKAQTDVKGRPAPAFKGIVARRVDLFGDGENVVRPHARGPQRLVGIPQRGVGDANLA